MNKPLTYYVINPRNESCKRVNPQLWAEFCNRFGTVNNSDFFTEAYCVQWLDYYYENENMYVAI